VIVFALGSGPQRYNELLQRIEGISQKMLTQTLKRLQSDNLLEKRSEVILRKKVEYSLTPLGKGFYEQLLVICKWRSLIRRRSKVHAQADLSTGNRSNGISAIRVQFRH
jgi:DNA-binding HxlR family transcriptional regulator